MTREKSPAGFEPTTSLSQAACFATTAASFRAFLNVWPHVIISPENHVFITLSDLILLKSSVQPCLMTG